MRNPPQPFRDSSQDGTPKSAVDPLLGETGNGFVAAHAFKDVSNDTHGTNPQVIRIGNQTAYTAGALMEPFEFALQQGFTAFEFFPDRGPAGTGGWAETDLDDSARRWIRQAAVEHHLELTVHATLEFNPLAGHEDARLYSTVAFAHDIGATLVNLHLDASAGADAFVDALGPTLLATAEADLRLAIENTIWTGPAEFNDFFAALHQRADLPSAHVGMCFDLGHANLHGATRNNYWAYLDALAAGVRIIHLHLHENFGDRDSHLPLFTGPARNTATGIAGMLSRVRQRGFAGCAILEQWPQPPSLLVNARDGLLNLLHAAPAVEATV
jgi:sugar phosphate isomerase/epimerase